MSDGGSDDAYGVGRGNCFGHGCEDAGSEFFADAPGRFRGDVEHAGKVDKAGSGEFRINAGVFLAESAGAKDGHAQFVRGFK